MNRPGRRPGALRSPATGLVVVNGAAAVVLLSTPVPSAPPPDGTALIMAVLLGVVLSGTQVGCAAALGTRLRGTRRIAPTGLRSWNRVCVALGAALASLSVPTGWAIYSWAQERVAPDHWQVAVLLGLALALQAWVAPWLLVADMAQGGDTAGPPRTGGSADDRRRPAARPYG